MRVDDNDNIEKKWKKSGVYERADDEEKIQTMLVVHEYGTMEKWDEEWGGFNNEQIRCHLAHSRDVLIYYVDVFEKKSIKKTKKKDVSFALCVCV